MSDYEKAKADLDYVLEEEELSDAAVVKLLGLDYYIDQQQQRIGATAMSDDFPRFITVAAEDRLGQCEYIRRGLAEKRVAALYQRIRELEYVLREMEQMATHCDQGQYIDYPNARIIFEEARELLEEPR